MQSFIAWCMGINDLPQIAEIIKRYNHTSLPKLPSPLLFPQHLHSVETSGAAHMKQVEEELATLHSSEQALREKADQLHMELEAKVDIMITGTH